MQTSLAEERAEQRRWRLRPPHAGNRAFDRMVDAEFRNPVELEDESGRRLAAVIGHAVRFVPHYAELFARLKLRPQDVRRTAELRRLPILRKPELIELGAKLRAVRLPQGERIHGWFASSGTTGRPARVLMTHGANLMFSYFTQRQCRWFRLDPAGIYAILRLPGHMPKQRDGRPLADGATGRRRSWRYVGTFFETGPLVYFNVTNPVEAQLAWLAAERPDYLQSYSESLEHLAFACDGQWPAPGIKRLHAISEQLTASMRRRIEGTVGAPVEQSYGLNEIGLVATRCAAGRYHVNVEHCIVEIVDKEGEPVAHGAVGHVVVTALTNPAMPLLRYDTGDMARMTDGPCPCGRTLPSFGELVGRYSRIAYLPEGTLPMAGALRAALEEMPAAAVRGLRQFQIHQYRDRSFELRLVSDGGLRPGLEEAIRAAWRKAGDAVPLRILRVDAIARSPGGKFQDFTSDFMPSLGDPES